MAVTWITPVDVTPTADSTWQDVDISAHVASGATGAIVHIDGGGFIGLRKNGSTDNRFSAAEGLSPNHWAVVGIDGSDIFECYLSDGATVIYLVGYTGSESVFFTNAIDKSLGSINNWLDIDISGDTSTDTAIAAFCEIEGPVSNVRDWGLRKNGSTDNRVNRSAGHSWAIIGCDESEIFEHRVDSTSIDLFVIGYMTSGFTANTNAIDRSIGATGAWTNIPVTAGGAGVAIEVDVSDSSDGSFGLRDSGSSENIVGSPNYSHAWGILKSTSDSIEGYIDSTTNDFYEIGIFDAPAPAPAPSVNPNSRVTQIKTHVLRVAALVKSVLRRLPLFSLYAELLTQYNPESAVSSTASFSRASTRMITDDDGVIQSVASETAGFNGNGVIIEPSRINLAFYSVDLTDSSWFKVNGTISANNIVCPDGVSRATVEFVEDVTTASLHYPHQSVTRTSGVQYTESVYVKRGVGTRDFRLAANASVYGEASGITVDLDDGSVIAIQGTPDDYGVDVLANDWYRVWFVDTATATSSVGTRLYLTTGGVVTHDGDGVSSLYLWNYQVEAGAFPTTPILTTSAAVTRNTDVLSFGWPDNINDINNFVIAFFWTPLENSQGTINLLSGYVDASNEVTVLHDGTDFIFRKRVSGTNYDATLTQSYTKDTTYSIKVRLSSDNGVDIWIDDVKGTGDADVSSGSKPTSIEVGMANGSGIMAGLIKSLVFNSNDMSDNDVIDL